MKAILNFNDIATHEPFKEFEGKRVAIEIISLDGKEIDKLQNKYLYYCYQIAAFLTETHGIPFYVKDAIFINSLKIKHNVIRKIDKDGNMLFIVNSKPHELMNAEELKTILLETVKLWLPLFDLELDF